MKATDNITDIMIEDMIKSLRLSKKALQMGKDKNNPGKFTDSIKLVDEAIARLKKKR